MSTFRERLELAYDFLRGQLDESSTVRGLAGVAVLAGGTLAKWPPDVTLFVFASVGAVLKIVLPDDLPWSRSAGRRP
jgi:hypothetical protein